MKIKRLEISGFKSFADKVVLDFQQGVTGVVGPNGCGKSNIVDAIRWCMGEQSAKNLRGKAMEDIIFAGSESRKPLGLAEVSLVFSTEDGLAPARYLDYSEVQLTRRLYRNGDSDYLINKTPCRLLDITELFMDTGVGTRAYSIIEQGKIGQILHSRPEERRFLIEEAAGVTKYKSRKHLALKKIEATRLNLSRLGDVLGEIKRQLSSLQRQAKKAEKFRELREELREIELLFTAREYRETLDNRRIAELELSALNDRIRQIFGASSNSEVKVEEAKVRLLEAEQKLTSTQENVFRVKSEFDSSGNRLEFQHKELASLNLRISRLESETEELALRINDQNAERETLELRRDKTAGENALLLQEMQQSEASLAALQKTEEELNRALEAKRKELFSAMSESAQLKSRSETAEKRLLGVSERILRHGREGIQIMERMETARRRAEALNAELAVVRQELEGHRAEQSQLRKREEELVSRLPELEKIWQEKRDQLNRSSSRLHSLKELEARFDGYGQGVRNLMNAGGSDFNFRGVLADRITVPAELETALEAVLADRLQSILCSNEQEALQALEYLKTGKGGRASLVVPVNHEPHAVSVPEGAEFLFDQVQTSGEYSGIIRMMLAGCYLVDTIDRALSLSRKHPELYFVTPAGDMAGLGGVVTGGSDDQVQHGLIHKKREMRELESSVATLEKESGEAGKESDVVKLELRETTEAIQATSSELHRVELKLAGLTKDLQQSAEEISRMEERLDLQAMESANLEEEKDMLESEQKTAQARMKEVSEIAVDLETVMTTLKDELEERRSELALARERVVAVRVQAATLKEQHETAVKNLEALERSREELLKRNKADQGELAKGKSDLAVLQQDIAAGAELLETLVLRQAATEKQLEKAREEYEAAAAVLAENESAAKQLREEHEAVRQSQADWNLKFSTLSMKSEHLERTLLEKSRITMADALKLLENSEFDEAMGMSRKNELQRLLEEMGEVNLMAIEEYAQMEERFNFLSTQKNDLEESLQTLQQAIQRINRTTRQRFLETYNLVNTKFQEVFPRLFCGGKAELRLTNEEDLLETGIDIIVQPPGKKLQNVTLLSGGEKALTAVALIFSIFLIKPTPFCLLDEVDAPLDDANIGRFNDMVREMSEISQFIIITHNKATMQVADTLYGITMESPGTSKMVSVKLNS